MTDMAHDFGLDRIQRRQDRRERLRMDKGSNKHDCNNHERHAAMPGRSRTLWSQSTLDLASRPLGIPLDSSRRPYSTSFTGVGGIGTLNNLIAPDLRSARRSGGPRTRTHVPDSNPTTDSAPARPPAPPHAYPPQGIHVPNLAAAPSIHVPHPNPTRPATSLPSALRIQIPQPARPPTLPRLAPISQTEQPSISHNLKIDKCVADLRELGYGHTGNDGADGRRRQNIDRLRVYAAATNGDVSEAVEMIEEERRAWAGLNRL